MSATRNANKSKVSKTRRAATKKAAAAAPVKKPKKAVSRAKAVRNKFGLKQTQMSRLVGISPRKLSELESKSREPRPETKRRLTEVDRLHKALDEIMDAEDIAGWMEEPNDAFGGSTPLQLVERGEIDRLWQMIFAIRSGQPV
ncbi:MAG: helix-turn-helix domain-containing protein [Phycisphaerales bacterium JB054]